MLRDPRDVEDAFQATFLVLVRKAPTIRERGLLSSWLYGVAYRVANRARAEAIQRQVREIGVERLDAHAAAIPAEVAEIGPVLDQELSRLPAKYREPLVLCYEARSTDMDRTGDAGYQFVGGRSDRGCFREGSNCRKCTGDRPNFRDFRHTGRGCAIAEPRCPAANNIGGVRRAAQGPGKQDRPTLEPFDTIAIGARTLGSQRGQG
jgi:hypothetical protein